MLCFLWGSVVVVRKALSYGSNSLAAYPTFVRGQSRVCILKKRAGIMRAFLLLVFFLVSSAHALVLEKLIQDGTLETTLKNKRIGYYVGSFDPLHKGHEAVAQLPMKKGLCDLVIIYPAWGGDFYKTRIDVNLRHDMVFSVFRNHPTVIVTRLTPKDLQAVLTVSDISKVKNKRVVKPAFERMKFIGVIGSDTALWLDSNEKAFSAFMTGIQIPEKYQTQTLGGLMALPAESFIVALREGDDLSSLKGKIRDREIFAVIESEYERTLSSTAVKKALKKGKPITPMVSTPVLEIIEKHGLYKQ